MYLPKVYMETFQICKRYHNFFISVNFFIKIRDKKVTFVLNSDPIAILPQVPAWNLQAECNVPEQEVLLH